MISVELLKTEPGRLKIQAGRIDFYALPVKKESDFVSVPKDIISFADAQAVSLEIFRQGIQGRVSRYEWRKSGSEDAAK